MMLVKEVTDNIFYAIIQPFFLFFPLKLSEEDVKDKGKLYKPTSKLASLAESFSSRSKANEAKETKESKDKSLQKKEKKKSNLEMFKEELRV